MFEVWYALDNANALILTTDDFDYAVAECDRLNLLAPVGEYTIESNWDPSMDPGCEMP